MLCEIWQLLTKVIEHYKSVCITKEDWESINAWINRKTIYYRNQGCEQDWDTLLDIAMRQINEAQIQNFPDTYYGHPKTTEEA